MARRSFFSRFRSFLQKRGGFSSVRSEQRRIEKQDKKIRKSLGIPKGASNEWIRQQMSDATSDKSSVFSKSMVKSFWSLTRDIWNRDDVPTGGKIDAILQYFNTNDLSEAMTRAFSDSKDIFESRVNMEFDMFKYSVNSLFGVGFFSTG